MIYLISQDWANTSNNHAGMKYLCNKLQEVYPDTYISFSIPCFLYDELLSKNRVVKKIQLWYAQHLAKRYSMNLAKNLLSRLKPHDIVFLMEYLEKLSPMKSIVDEIKAHNPAIDFWAMVHLVPSKLEKSFSNNKEFYCWTKNITYLFTFGRTLSDYLHSRGFSQNRIITTFHYVDDYYQKKTNNIQCDSIKVIAMGNQMRNRELLRKIVCVNPDVDFIICQGVDNMEDDFFNLKNVKLIPFVPESELRQYMQLSDVSLNVMQDTIGSNVIVTSLAMGLAMVCSDVGSIRDYCDENNTFFCSNDSIDGFNSAIRLLSKNRTLLDNMKLSARKKAETFSINQFHLEIKKILG